MPALQASADIELTAVCTTRADSAEAARQAYGARLAFDDWRKMVASSEIDAVAALGARAAARARHRAGRMTVVKLRGGFPQCAKPSEFGSAGHSPTKITVAPSACAAHAFQ